MAHRVTDLGEAYRIGAVLLLGQSRPVAEVVDALLFDPDTVRGNFKGYKEAELDGLSRMAYVGTKSLFNAMSHAPVSHASPHRTTLSVSCVEPV